LKEYCNYHLKMPPKEYKINNKSISSWILNQHNNKIKGRLSEERINKLQQIDAWEWNANIDEKWRLKFNHVKKFYDEYQKYPSEYDKNIKIMKLGKWLSHQKFLKKRGKLSNERIKLLETLDKWTWKGNLDTKWLLNYNKVKDY